MSLNKPLALFVALLPSALHAEKVTRAQYVMGTVLEIQAEGAGAEAAVAQALAEVLRWDDRLSLYKKDSELSRLNASAAKSPFVCSPDVWRALTSAVALSHASSELFNPAVLPVLRHGVGALPLTRLDDIVFDARRRTVSFNKNGMGLTLDAHAKGWALDQAAVLLRRRGISALLNFGGQLLAVGSRPWPMIVPGRAGTYALREASASTSGNGEQPGHIVDPRTGFRLTKNPTVTVVAPSGAEADAWSTAVFVAGPASSAARGRCALFEGEQGLPESCRPFFKETASPGARK